MTRPDMHEGDAEEGSVDDWVPDPPMALDPTITQARTGSPDGSERPEPEGSDTRRIANKAGEAG